MPSWRGAEMRAVRLHGIGDLRIEEVPAPPPPQDDQVLVRVTAAGICGSDLHNFRTGQWISRPVSIPGHEFTGTVLAAGPAAGGFKPGDTVVADSRFWCGACPRCTAGEPNLCENLGYVGEVCDGGFAEQVTLPARLLHRVDPAVPPAIATTAEPLAVAKHAITRLRPDPGAPVLVAGCGPIGGFVALLLAEAGHPVLVADRNAARRSRVASVAGATETNLDRESVTAALHGGRLRFAVDATGNIAAIRSSIDCLDSGGTLLLVGISHGTFDLDPNHVVERELSLIGCSAFSTELPDTIARLPALAPKIARLIDREIGLDDVPAAYEDLLAGRAAGLKAIIRP